jgi:hypothetical protein
MDKSKYNQNKSLNISSKASSYKNFKLTIHLGKL